MRKIHLIGNAHLDPVWLWQWQEGFAEIKATFRSALDRMEEFEDYKFTSACSVYYMWIEKSDPNMFEEIQKRVQEGRWCITGGWFLQPDCNIPCGESFARHGLISQRYFQEKFGLKAVTGYNVDSFGHNGNLPQILKNCQLENYVFMRPMSHEKKIVQSLFCWQGVDGSCVTTYRIPFFYNIDSTRMGIFEEIDAMEDSTDLMAFYGIGNHGGGATVELLSQMHKTLPPHFVYSTPDAYFHSVDKESLPVVCDELQYHAKGCYSACSQIKADNRKAENLILNTEKFSVLSQALLNTPYPKAELDRAWKNILFNQFHDTLGGCSIKEAYTDAQYVHFEAINIAERNTNFALQQISWQIDTMDHKELKAYDPNAEQWQNEERIGTPVVIFNSLAHEVTSVMTVRRMPKYVEDCDGRPVAFQRVRDSKTDVDDKYATAFSATIPAFGYTTYKMYFEGERKADFQSPFTCSENSIENSFISVHFNGDTGEIDRIYDKKNRCELLEGSTSTVLIDETHCDTWAHGIERFKDVAETAEKGSIKLLETGPVRAVMRCTTQIGHSEIIRDYSLEADSRVIQTAVTVNFFEKHKMLKFRIPVRVSDPLVKCEIPFGYIEKPNDGSEQVCGSWFSMEDGKKGLGVANDSKHSFDAEGNVLSLTVLRGAIYADHYGNRDEFCEYMDQGTHCFMYSLFPFISLSDTLKKAQELNHKPVSLIETFHKGSLGTHFSAISLSEENIAVTAVKKHEDTEDIILRCYETQNRDTDVNITLFGTTFQTHFSRGQIKTFLIGTASVKEVDFIEENA